MQVKFFEKFFETAEIAKLTPEEYRAYIDNLNSYRDLKNSLDYAEAKGKAEGRAEGKAEGRAEGKAEGRAEGKAEGEKLKAMEIAKKAKALGLSIEQIKGLTNLTKEEIGEIT
jgi:predicted transposase YdaD